MPSFNTKWKCSELWDTGQGLEILKLLKAIVWSEKKPVKRTVKYFEQIMEYFADMFFFLYYFYG